MSESLVTVFGGSGFIGRYVVQRLARRGHRVRIAVRHPDEALFLKPLGSVGQIQIVQANVRDAGSVARAVEGADAVVNLVGILSQSGKQTFEKVQNEGAEHIAAACADNSVKSLIHISAIGADEKSDAAYARSKAAGEAAIKKVFPKATILRPSLVFGPEDDFTNRFASLARILPIMPVIAGDTRFQPVYVGDVADAVLACLEMGDKARGKTFELGGPKIYSFRELLHLILQHARIKRPLLDVPMPLARLQAACLQFLPKPPLTPDQLKLLQKDNVVAKGAKTLKTLGLGATPAEAILPTYLRRYGAKGQFTR